MKQLFSPADISSKLVAGVDEAGRGCLCGPVTAAAVILDKQYPIEGLADSKQLKARQRETLRSLIKQRALAWAVGWASITEIDSVNILQATYLAMQRAVERLIIQPEQVLVDGNSTPSFTEVPATAIIAGDMLVPEISAASILAKTSRDELMIRWHNLYPQYSLDRHKGYPTKLHKKALMDNGLTPLHRKTFKW